MKETGQELGAKHLSSPLCRSAASDEDFLIPREQSAYKLYHAWLNNRSFSKIKKNHEYSKDKHEIFGNN